MDDRARGRRVRALTGLGALALLALGVAVGFRVYRYVGSDAYLIARVVGAPDEVVSSDAPDQSAVELVGPAERLAERCHEALPAVLDELDRCAVDEPARRALLGVASAIQQRHNQLFGRGLVVLLGKDECPSSSAALRPEVRARLYAAAAATLTSRDPLAAGLAREVILALEVNHRVVTGAVTGHALAGVDPADRVVLPFDVDEETLFGEEPLPDPEAVAPHIDVLVRTGLVREWTAERLHELARLGPVSAPALLAWLADREALFFESWEVLLEDLVRVDPGLEQTVAALERDPASLIDLMALAAPWIARVAGRRRVMAVLAAQNTAELKRATVEGEDPIALGLVRLAGARHADAVALIPGAKEVPYPIDRILLDQWREAAGELEAWWERVGPDLPLDEVEGWVLVRATEPDPGSPERRRVTLAGPAPAGVPARLWRRPADELAVPSRGETWYLLGPLPAGPCVVWIEIMGDASIRREVTVPGGERTVEIAIDRR